MKSVTAFMVDLIDDPELERECGALVEGGVAEDGISAAALVDFAKYGPRQRSIVP
jgi:hypothetical protein